MSESGHGSPNRSVAIAALAVAALLGSSAACLELSPRGIALCDAGDSSCDGPDAGVPEIGPFGPLTLIAGPFDPGNPEVNEDDPIVTEDLLELYFNSDRDGQAHGIWVSKRTSPADPWGAPIRLAAIDDAIANPTDPVIAPDGLTLWVANPLNNIDWNIQRFERASRATDEWAVIEQESELDSPQRDAAGGISGDGMRLLFMSNRDPLEQLHVFMASRASPSADWSIAPTEALAEVNFRCRNQGPSISPNGQILLWGSLNEPCDPPTRPYIARWDAGAEAFVRDVRAQEALDALGEDGATYDDPWLSPDGGYIILVRQSLGNPQDRKLYHAFRDASQ